MNNNFLLQYFSFFKTISLTLNVLFLCPFPGIGLAKVAAVKGYRCVIVIPDRMSMDKVHTLKALGAEVVRTDSTLPMDSPDMVLVVAQRLHKEIPNSFLVNQVRTRF